jgi:thioredoxin reductase (NADPH)
MPSEEAFMGKGVSACATCDGFFYRNQDVCVIGGGNTAVEEALYLAGIANKVTVIHRRDTLRASKIMQERVLNTKNIKVYWNSETDEVLGENAVEAVRIHNNKTNEKIEIPVTGFFVAIGHKPNSDVFKDYITTDSEGYVTTVPGTAKTNVEGVFACGDLQDKVYRQAVTAAGTGCMAALESERWLSEKGIH